MVRGGRRGSRRAACRRQKKQLPHEQGSDVTHADLRLQGGRRSSHGAAAMRLSLHRADSQPSAWPNAYASLPALFTRDFGALAAHAERIRSLIGPGLAEASWIRIPQTLP